MKELSYNVPGLLFPTISLLMLAYTNRFQAVASVARQLVDKHGPETDESVHYQIDNLRTRIRLMRQAQGLGVLSLTFCTASLFLLFLEKDFMAQAAFGGALVLMLVSLLYSLREIQLSARALDRALSGVFVGKK